MNNGKNKRRFSLKTKLVLIFGILIAIASVVEGVLAINIARKAVSEKVEAHLTVKSMSDSLTESMKEQENGSREVLIAIKNINTVTMEVQSGSEEMLKGGDGVVAEMHNLSDLTHIITDSMNEMASGAMQINGSVQEVQSQSGDIFLFFR